MPIKPFPTQTDGSLGRAKSNNVAVEDLDIQVPAAEWNNVVTWLLTVINELGATDGTDAGTVWEYLTETSQVFWQWNGTDVTQFGDGVGGPTAEQGTTTGTLTVETLDAPDSSAVNVLEYTHSGTDGVDAYYVINDLPALPNRFTILARMGPREVTGYDNTRPGIIVFWQDATHFGYIARPSTAANLRFSMCNDTAEDDGRVDYNGTTIVTSPGNFPDGTYMAIDMDITDPTVSTDARISVGVYGQGWGDTTYLTQSTGTEVGTGNKVADSWDNWAASTVKNIGICFREFTGGGSTYITDLKIVTHRFLGAG